MELKHLQALVAVADCGTFSGAAELLGTVQSNVSSHVARLERELDVVLVDRSAGRLTDEGEIVVERARRVIAELDALVTDVGSLGREVVGTVRVGMIGTTARWLVPLLLARLADDYPQITVHVSDGTSTTLEPQLVTHGLDLAVVSLPVPDDELSASPLFEEDLMLVVPVDHPLAHEFPDDAGVLGEDSDRRQRVVPLELLGNVALLLPSPGTALRDEIDSVLEPAGVVLHPLMELDGLRLIASLTFDGYGPAILPASAVPGHLRPRFRLLGIEGMPRRTVGVAVRRRGRPSAPVRAVAGALYDVINQARVPAGLHPFERRPL
jgi:LysR family hydrogen peroxide-inducible transcriptional activator